MYKKIFPVTYNFFPRLEYEFSESPVKDQFLEILKNPKKESTENLLYIHIPFCQDICYFCPLGIKIGNNERVISQYTDALIKEMKIVSCLSYVKDMKFDAVYFGGGSPSILNIHQLELVFKNIFLLFDVNDHAEISFEGEPRSLCDQEKLRYLEDVNVSRISFGLQTYNDKFRKQLNIGASLHDIDKLNNLLQKRSFKEINVDMIFDLPGQTLTDLEDDLECLKNDDFDSIDYYNLHYYEINEKLRSDISEGIIPPRPNEQMRLAMFEQIRSYMKDMGYYHVSDEIFSKEPKLCEYFRLLWGGGYGDYKAETLAIGAGAQGYLSGFGYSNCLKPHEYIKKINKEQYVFEMISTLMEDVRNRGAALFPKFHRISIENLSVIETIPKNIIDDWRNNGFVFEKNGELFLSEIGKCWAKNISAEACESSQRKVRNLRWPPFKSIDELLTETKVAY